MEIKGKYLKTGLKQQTGAAFHARPFQFRTTSEVYTPSLERRKYFIKIKIQLGPSLTAEQFNTTLLFTNCRKIKFRHTYFP